MIKKDTLQNLFTVPGFLKEFSTNKYVLYVVAFIALTNILGYMMMGKNVCVLLFVLIAYAMTYITKNMVFVLIAPIVTVGFFALCKEVKPHVETFLSGALSEGDIVESADGTQMGVVETVEDDMVTIRVTPVDDSEEGELISLPMDTTAWQKIDTDDDMEEDDDVEEEDDLEETEFMEEDDDGIEEMSNRKDKKSAPKPTNDTMGMKATKKMAELDDAAPIDEENVQEMDLQKIMGETKELMGTQKQLMDAMKNVTPMLKQAQGMIDSLDMGEMPSGVSKKKEGFASMGANRGTPIGSAYP